jgi:hypothetical protein
MGGSLWPLKDHSGRMEVTQTSLDRFAAEWGLERADLIKVDVEGAEPEVLEGMRALAARSPDLSVIVEFKPGLLARRGYPPNRLLELLASLGFAAAAIGTGGRLLPLDPAGRAAEGLGTCNLLATRPPAEPASPG